MTAAVSSASTIMLVAGEASGDAYGAAIAQRLFDNADQAKLKLVGMGAQKMRAAGIELLVDSSDIAVVGLVEVLSHWPQIKAALQTLTDYLQTNPPDLLVLIDYQEFNLRLAKQAKALGIKVLFYIGPQVWAWREQRLKKFRDVVDMMAVIFPFETRYYSKYNIPVRYVGHPLAHKVQPNLSKELALQTLGLAPNRPTVCLLPGSRRSEIKQLLAILVASAARIAHALPEVQFILPVAATLRITELQQQLAASPVPIILVDSLVYDAIYYSDAAIVASGTATLEAALLNTPMAIVYRIAPLSYAILKRLIKVPYIGLANIVAGSEVAPEFVQQRAQPELIAAEIIQLLSNPNYHASRQQGLRNVREQLGTTDGMQRIADLILEMLH